MSLLFKDYSVVKAIYLLFRFVKPKSFLWNSKSADRNRADRYARKTHQPHTEKKMTFERVSVKKVIPHIPFLEQPPYFSSPSLFVEKMWIPLLPFLEIFFGKIHPSSLLPSALYKGWISTRQTPHIFTCLKLLINGFEKLCIDWTINKLCYYGT